MKGNERLYAQVERAKRIIDGCIHRRTTSQIASMLFVSVSGGLRAQVRELHHSGFLEMEWESLWGGRTRVYRTGKDVNGVRYGTVTPFPAIDSRVWDEIARGNSYSHSWKAVLRNVCSVQTAARRVGLKYGGKAIALADVYAMPGLTYAGHTVNLLDWYMLDTGLWRYPGNVFNEPTFPHDDVRRVVANKSMFQFADEWE